MTEKQDKLGNALGQYKHSAHLSAAELAIRTSVAAIPYAGGSLLALWEGLAQRRVQERLNIMFEEMKNSLEAMDTGKVDREFFNTPEFQTLFYLLVEKLHTTHDEAKLKMFGDALANSGNIDSDAADKELFIRTLRDLNPSDLQYLSREDLANWVRYERPADDAHNEDMSRFSRLLGLGLVADRSIPGLDGANTRLFKRSDFGRRFLAFVTLQDKTRE